MTRPTADELMAMPRENFLAFLEETGMTRPIEPEPTPEPFDKALAEYEAGARAFAAAKGERQRRAAKERWGRAKDRFDRALLADDRERATPSREEVWTDLRRDNQMLRDMLAERAATPSRDSLREALERIADRADSFCPQECECKADGRRTWRTNSFTDEECLDSIHVLADEARAALDSTATEGAAPSLDPLDIDAMAFALEARDVQLGGSPHITPGNTFYREEAAALLALLPVRGDTRERKPSIDVERLARAVQAVHPNVFPVYGVDFDAAGVAALIEADRQEGAET